MATAGLLIYLLVHYYGATGQYQAGNVLLEPAVAEKMAYNSYDIKTNDQNARFVFQDALFTFPGGQNAPHSNILTAAQYEKIYHLVQEDMSLISPGNEITALFDTQPSAELAIRVKTNSPAKWQAESLIFQKMQVLVNEKYYRISLHEENPGENWVYFHHKRIFQEILEIAGNEQ